MCFGVDFLYELTANVAILLLSNHHLDFFVIIIEFSASLPHYAPIQAVPVL
jgi:hypothetical protein